MAADGIIGIQPPPRVLFVYSDPQYEQRAQQTRAAFAEMIPTAEVVPADGLQQVYLQGYDLAVMFGDHVAAGPIHEIIFGGKSLGLVRNGPDAFYTLLRSGKTIATRWLIPPEVAGRERELVEQDLLPQVPRGGLKPPGYKGWSEVLAVRDGLMFRPWPNTVQRRLLVSSEDEVFAAVFALGGTWRWVLPEASDAIRWVRFVLEHLNGQDAAKFPLRTGWAELPAFQTAAELSAAKTLEAVSAEREQVLADLARREAGALQALEDARAAAERGYRALIREQGDELARVVTEALTMIGFVVTDSDDAAEQGKLLEDLQIRLPDADEPAALALAEVKGYTGGARVNDFQRLARFVLRYQQRHGVTPARRWYIVNELIGRPPTDRKGPLLGNQEDVETFADDGGLVIGTEELLKLVLRVERGELCAGDARRSLWESVGRYTDG